MTETLNASINPPVAKCGESIEASAQTHQVATGIATASVPAIDETEIPPENLDVQIAEPLASPLEAEGYSYYNRWNIMASKVNIFNAELSLKFRLRK